MKRAMTAALAVCLALVGVLVYAGRAAAEADSIDTLDLDRVRAMGNGLTLYYKKYSYFPALADVMHTNAISEVRMQGNCRSLKLLMAGGFSEDAKEFFSPRSGVPDDKTLSLMTKELNVDKDPTWASSYAYDAGHNPNHGAMPLFGTPEAWLESHREYDATVLTCEMVGKMLSRDKDTNTFVCANHAIGSTVSSNDNIFKNDIDAFGWRDSWLRLDVPSQLTEPYKTPAAK